MELTNGGGTKPAFAFKVKTFNSNLIRHSTGSLWEPKVMNLGDKQGLFSGGQVRHSREHCGSAQVRQDGVEKFLTELNRLSRVLQRKLLLRLILIVCINKRSKSNNNSYKSYLLKCIIESAYKIGVLSHSFMQRWKSSLVGCSEGSKTYPQLEAPAH